MEQSAGKVDLHQEIIKIKRVIMQHYPSHVSNHFKYQSGYHSDEKPPGPVSYSEYYLGEQDEAK